MDLFSPASPYEIPPLPEGPPSQSPAGEESSPRRTIYFGIAGWSYEDWVGTVYPRGLPPGQRLAYIAHYLDCVEVNSTFYAVPRPELVSRWAASVPPGFLFTCKVPKSITHQEPPSREDAASLREALRALTERGKLGALLAQFPWYFRFSQEGVRHVEQICELLEGFPLVLELRHRSFLTPDFLQFLTERRVGLANIDLPQSRTSMPPTSHAFGPCGYFRFHGRNSEAWFDPKAGRDQKYDYLYSTGELEPWTERIRHAAARAQRVFVIANNHYRGQAPANALDVAALLGERREAPPPLLQAFPHLAERAAQAAKKSASPTPKRHGGS